MFWLYVPWKFFFLLVMSFAAQKLQEEKRYHSGIEWARKKKTLIRGRMRSRLDEENMHECWRKFNRKWIFYQKLTGKIFRRLLFFCCGEINCHVVLSIYWKENWIYLLKSIQSHFYPNNTLFVDSDWHLTRGVSLTPNAPDTADWFLLN